MAKARGWGGGRGRGDEVKIINKRGAR